MRSTDMFAPDLVQVKYVSVAKGRDIAVEARRRVITKHPVLNLMMHVDPR